MKLVNQRLNFYLRNLESDAPAPGGGSVSALAGAEGAALLGMVCNLTTSKERYAQHHELVNGIYQRIDELTEELTAAIDADTEAFNLVAAAYKMPNGEKRSEAIKAGTLEATKVPFHVMEMSLECLKLAEKLKGHYNINCDSDFGVALLNLVAAMKGAWLNVRINLPGLKDEELEAKYEKAGLAMLNEGEAIAEKLAI